MLLHPLSPRPLPIPVAVVDGPTTELTVRVDLVAGRITLSGELDRHTAHHLLDAATALADGGHTGWVVDVSDLHFCDTAGLRAISAVYRRALRHDARLTVVEPGAWLRRALTALRLDGHLFPGPAAGSPPARLRAAR